MQMQFQLKNQTTNLIPTSQLNSIMIDHLFIEEEKNKDSVEALKEAQKIAFGPVVFQTVMTLRNLGALEYIKAKKSKGATSKELAEHCKVSVYGIKTLLEMAASAGVVTFKDDVDTYLITRVGVFLNKDLMTTANLDFIQDICYEGLFNLEEAIKEEKPAGLRKLGNWSTVYEGLSQLNQQQQNSWFSFDHYYSDGAFPYALPIVFKNKPKTLFDVGGNTGKWAGQCYKFDPDVQVTILDLPGQLNKAKANLEAKGFTDRINFHEIDLLSDNPVFPHEADAIWMSQFLDCFSQEQIIKILRTASKAMNENSAVFIMETYWDNQRYEAATYSLHATSLYFTAIANGNSKMYHSDEMRKMVQAAGLKVVEEHAPVGEYHTIFKCMLA